MPVDAPCGRTRPYRRETLAGDVPTTAPLLTRSCGSGCGVVSCAARLWPPTRTEAEAGVVLVTTAGHMGRPELAYVTSNATPCNGSSSGHTKVWAYDQNERRLIYSWRSSEAPTARQARPRAPDRLRDCPLHSSRAMRAPSGACAALGVALGPPAAAAARCRGEKVDLMPRVSR